jgi:hypothetical protein
MARRSGLSLAGGKPVGKRPEVGAAGIAAICGTCGRAAA